MFDEERYLKFTFKKCLPAPFLTSKLKVDKNGHEADFVDLKDARTKNMEVTSEVLHQSHQSVFVVLNKMG